MKDMISTLVLLIALSGLEAAEEPVTAIVGGDVYTITSGVLREGMVIIKGRKIDRVGQDLPIPPGAEVIDARGKVVMPGLVAADAGNTGIRAAGEVQRIADSLDPFALPVSLALAAGVTTAYVTWGGGSADDPLGGTNAVLKMTEGSLEDMLLKEPAMVAINYSGASLTGRYRLQQQLREAQQYVRALADYERNRTPLHKGGEKEKPEALAPRKPGGIDSVLPLIRRELPARIVANYTDDILAALELVDEFNIRLVLEWPIEGWIVADEISRRNVPVILTPRDKIRPNEDISGPSGSTVECAKILRAAGVKFAIVPPSTSFGPSDIPGRDLLTLPLEAAFAVRGGLDEQTALEAITLHAAEILGVADRVGSLQEGKDADLIILDGHPFDYKTFVETTIVNGRVLYEKDKAPFFAHIKRER